MLALFLLTIACADPLCCADGCERGNMATTRATQPGADCPTCLSVIAPRQHALLGHQENSIQLPEIADGSPISTFRKSVDHPPRFA